MENLPYWQKQEPGKPLFPDIEWSKPEQRSRSGKLGIIGGNQLGFAGLSDSYSFALKSGIGEIKMLLPDNLKSKLNQLSSDIIYGKSNPSGGLGQNSISEFRSLGDWADSLLFIGDCGKNSETAILYEKFVTEYEKPITITRDAIDLLVNSFSTIVNKSNVLLVASFPQIQKLFQAVYYPKVLTFSMQLTNLIEALHKFTITYPIKIAVYQHENMILAIDGKVITTASSNPMDIWRGKTASKASVYWTWNQAKPLEAIATSFVSN